MEDSLPTLAKKKYLIKEEEQSHDPKEAVVIVSRKTHIKEAIDKVQAGLLHSSIVLILGCDETIGKAISIVEIVKR